jgi:hypothetical protein
MARSGQGAQIFALVMMVAALVAIILLKGQCSRAVGGYFETLDEPARRSRPAAP